MENPTASDGSRFAETKADGCFDPDDFFATEDDSEKLTLYPMTEQLDGRLASKEYDHEFDHK